MKETGLRTLDAGVPIGTLPPFAECHPSRGGDCSSFSVPLWAAIALVLLFGLVVYQWVRIADLLKRDDARTARRRSGPRRLRRPPIDAPAADHLEALAEYTAQYQRPFAWMNPGTITGKLTMATWITRWWAGGTSLRKVLLWEVVKLSVTAAVISVLIVRYT
jgi:hypothetical protein